VVIERLVAGYRVLAIQAPAVTSEQLVDAALLASGNGAAQP